jgi:hypothetical protein
MTLSLEALERFHGAAMREQVQLLEHEPVRELVTPVDVCRTDHLGRRVVASPPASRQRNGWPSPDPSGGALVEPNPPPPDGWLEPGAAGFTPTNTVVGRWTIEQPQ